MHYFSGCYVHVDYCFLHRVLSVTCSKKNYNYIPNNFLVLFLLIPLSSVSFIFSPLGISFLCLCLHGSIGNSALNVVLHLHCFYDCFVPEFICVCALKTYLSLRVDKTNGRQDGNKDKVEGEHSLLVYGDEMCTATMQISVPALQEAEISLPQYPAIQILRYRKETSSTTNICRESLIQQHSCSVKRLHPQTFYVSVFLLAPSVWSTRYIFVHTFNHKQ